MELVIDNRCADENLAGNRLPQFDPQNDRIIDDPLPLFAMYRDVDPVHWGHSPDRLLTGAWYLFRYGDVMDVLADKRLGTDITKVWPHVYDGVSPEAKPFYDRKRLVMLFNDPPVHTRLRRLMNKAFTPRAVDALRPRLEEIANSLVDRIVDEHGDGSFFDFTREFAFPLPVIAICELLGVSSEDHEDFHRWSAGLISAIDLAPGDTTPLERAGAAVAEFSRYFESVVDQRRLSLSDDLISRLIAASDADAGGLSHDELIAGCVDIVFAGHETTVTMLGNALELLLRHPEQLALLRGDVDGLVGRAVDEVVRHAPPVRRTVPRFAHEDVQVGGRVIHAGEAVYPYIASANFDERVFQRPQEFDICRSDSRLASFGFGPHYCIGASLARLEVEVALRVLVERLPSLALDAQHLPLRARSYQIAAWQSIVVGV